MEKTKEIKNKLIDKTLNLHNKITKKLTSHSKQNNKNIFLFAGKWNSLNDFYIKEEIPIKFRNFGSLAKYHYRIPDQVIIVDLIEKLNINTVSSLIDWMENPKYIQDRIEEGFDVWELK